MNDIVQIGDATLYHGDCLEILPTLPKVDAVVTSPPYNNWRNKRTQKLRKDYWARTNINYLSYEDNLSDAEYQSWQISVINECLSRLNDNGTICYNHKDQIFNFVCTSPLTWLSKTNGIVRQRVTWDRCGMQAYNPVRFYRVEEDVYFIGHDVGSNFIWNKEAAEHTSIWRVTPGKKDGHPAPMPLELASRCISAFTRSSGVTLDPFMGSGTTGVACANLGRKFIGIEIEKKYFDIACERIEAAYAQGRLFE